MWDDCLRLLQAVQPGGMKEFKIRLRGRGEAEVSSKPATDAGKILRFDVFEPV